MIGLLRNRRLILLCWLALTAASVNYVRAADFVTSLKVMPAAEANKPEPLEVAKDDPVEKPKPDKRPVITARKGEKLVVKWRAANNGKKETYENVLIHFFVVKEKEIGQERIPDLGKDVYHEGAITIDFKPGDQARGQFTLSINQPGNYLVRVETAGLRGKLEQEFFTALDLVIK